KESYVLDFLELSNLENEKQLEDSLIDNISRFMLELGKGFAYVGRSKYSEAVTRGKIG
ncbi:MAG: DUF1016 domain-containing protein, partial [Richelia sp. SM2_1_7]|nr:DUF1016 domain-containing protein [Richelia sp. SM2_1_7]